MPVFNKMKPAQWGLDPGFVDSEWQWIWRHVVFATPFWERGGLNVYDLSHNHMVGAYTNGEVADWQDGTIGNGLDMEVVEYVDFGNLGGGTGFEEITILICFSSIDVTANHYILSQDASGGNQGDFSIRCPSQFDGGVIDAIDQFNSVTIVGTTDLNDGLVHVGGFTLDRTNGYRIFADGVLEGSDPTTGNTIWDGSASLQIGGVVNGNSTFSAAVKVYGVLILDIGLSENAVARLSNDFFGPFRMAESFAAFVPTVTGGILVHPGMSGGMQEMLGGMRG